jgi:6-phosphogluconolactonase
MKLNESFQLPDWLMLVPDIEALNRAAAGEFARCASAAINKSGRFTVALSGGQTPRAIYSLLARDYASSLPWERIYIFFGDERHVPPADPQSNYRMANESLLSHVPIPAENVHRIDAELEASAAAEQYQSVLEQFFDLNANELPRFDLVMLGMGDDGHTASLFPGTAALQEETRLVVANHVEKLTADRITFTLPVLNAAAEAMVIVAGVNKAPVVRQIIHSPATLTYPVQRVHPNNGRLLWIVEQHAAALA